MKKGVLGVGPKGIAYGFYEGNAVKVCTRGRVGMQIQHTFLANFVVYIDH